MSPRFLMMTIPIYFDFFRKSSSMEFLLLLALNFFCLFLLIKNIKIIITIINLYSLGLIALEVAANVILPDNGPDWLRIRHGDFSGLDFSNVSFTLMDVIRSMLNPIPSMRPTAHEILTHPLMKDIVKIRSNLIM